MQKKVLVGTLLTVRVTCTVCQRVPFQHNYSVQLLTVALDSVYHTCPGDGGE